MRQVRVRLSAEPVVIAPITKRRNRMNIEYLKVDRGVRARTNILRKLGIANLVSTAKFDIAAAHEALVRRQAVPERICADGLVVDVPAGVYHPLPDSSSEFFIRNIKAMNP